MIGSLFGLENLVRSKIISRDKLAIISAENDRFSE